MELAVKTTEVKTLGRVSLFDRSRTPQEVLLGSVLGSIGLFGQSRQRIVRWIVDNRRGELLVATSQEIADNTKTSPNTVKRTIIALMERGLLERLRPGVYAIDRLLTHDLIDNPNLWASYEVELNR